MNGDGPPIPSVEPADPIPKTNGFHKSTIQSHVSTSPKSTPAKREVDSEAMSDLEDSGPQKKKRKPSIEDDAAIAARLQAEEDKLARPTRGGTSRKAAVVKKKKTPKKKARSKVTGSDDSDLEGVEPKRKVNRDTGFHVSFWHNISGQLRMLIHRNHSTFHLLFRICLMGKSR